MRTMLIAVACCLTVSLSAAAILAPAGRVADRFNTDRAAPALHDIPARGCCPDPHVPLDPRAASYIAAPGAAAPAAEKPAATKTDYPVGKWTPIFNGKNLDGWTPKIRGYDAGDNFADTFRVKDGAIQVGYEKYDKYDSRFGHLFYKDTFSHYRIRVEYRFTGQQCPGGPGWALRNSGIMLHGQTLASMKKDQDFPASIEVQLLGGDGERKRTTANLCTPGTHIVMNDKLVKQHCINSNSKTYHGEQWVTCEVEVRGGNTIKHFINGEEVMSYEKPQLDDGTILTEGTISLQSESHPVEFRKVEVMVLEEK